MSFILRVLSKGLLGSGEYSSPARFRSVDGSGDSGGSDLAETVASVLPDQGGKIDAQGFIDAIKAKRDEMSRTATAGSGLLGPAADSLLGNQPGEAPGFWRSQANQFVRQLDRQPLFRIADQVRDYFTE